MGIRRGGGTVGAAAPSQQQQQQRPTRLALLVGLVGVGFFAGRQSAAVDRAAGGSPGWSSAHQLQLLTHDAPWSAGPVGGAAANATTRSSPAGGAGRGRGGSSSSAAHIGGGGSSTIRLHEKIAISEDADLFRRTFDPLVEAVLREEEEKDSPNKSKSKSSSCRASDVAHYREILRNLQKDPRRYEDDNASHNNNGSSNSKGGGGSHNKDGRGGGGNDCPLVFLFYYESVSTQLLNQWVQFYSNVRTRSCIKFIAPRRYRNTTGTRYLTEKLGFDLVGPSAVKQDKVINLALDGLQKGTLSNFENRYGEDVLVSVNDLDHLLVWFGPPTSATDTAANDGDEDGGLDGGGREGAAAVAASKPYRYSTYSDMVLLYVLELLSTDGCGNQQVHERFVVPCTCMVEDNRKYVPAVTYNDDNSEVEGEGIVYSEYGVQNVFHPTANFYLPRGRPKDVHPGEWDTGTVFANLRGFHQNAITCHKLGTHKDDMMVRARHAGVLHHRSSGGYLPSTAKYMHFLLNNGWTSNSKATVEDVVFCATHAVPSELIVQRARCRGVKELANILALVHQRRLCLEAGFDEGHCLDELACCVTTAPSGGEIDR